MRKGSIVRIAINRAKYGLQPTTSHYANILIGTVIKQHRATVSVKVMDLWSKAKPIKYLTIDRGEVIAIL